MTVKGKKILIVDDDKFLLDMYAVKFNEAGFETTLALSGADALKKIADGLSPDVLLLDLVMPEMSGSELLEKVHREPNAKNACIVVLSNQGQPADIEDAKKYGIDGYIVKANSIPSEVLEIVEEKLRSREK